MWLLKRMARVLFLPPSDAYVRSFLYLFYTLIKLYHTHKKIKKIKEWPVLWYRYREMR